MTTSPKIIVLSSLDVMVTREWVNRMYVDDHTHIISAPRLVDCTRDELRSIAEQIMEFHDQTQADKCVKGLIILNDSKLKSFSSALLADFGLLNAMHTFIPFLRHNYDFLSNYLIAYERSGTIHFSQTRWDMYRMCSPMQVLFPVRNRSYKIPVVAVG